MPAAARPPWRQPTGCPCGHAPGYPCMREITDFGLAYRRKVARQREAEGRDWAIPQTPAERILAIAHTYRETSDQHRADGDTRRADLYALGAVVLREVAVALEGTG